MKLIPINVECHSGYKADEYPEIFIYEDSKYEIKDITDRWYQGELNPEFPTADYFKVLTIERKEFILRHEKESDKWYLCIK